MNLYIFKKIPFSVSFIMFILLVLRIVFIGFMTAFTAVGEISWYLPAIDTSIYVFTVLFIIITINELDKYNIDGFSIGLIIFFKPISAFMEYFGGFKSMTLWSLIIIIITSILLLIFSIKKNIWNKSDIKKGAKKFFYGIAVGIVLSMVTVFPLLLQLPSQNHAWYKGANISFLLSSTLWRIPQQMGYAAVIEEPTFRGFLWGFLDKLKFKKILILLIQTILFVIAHIYYIPSGNWLSFLYIVPVGATVLGLLAWKQKSIAGSMGAHSIVNAISMNLVLIIVSMLNL